jgi:hypothetical protein
MHKSLQVDWLWQINGAGCHFRKLCSSYLPVPYQQPALSLATPCPHILAATTSNQQPAINNQQPATINQQPFCLATPLPPHPRNNNHSASQMWFKDAVPITNHPHFANPTAGSHPFTATATGPACGERVRVVKRGEPYDGEEGVVRMGPTRPNPTKNSPNPQSYYVGIELDNPKGKNNGAGDPHAVRFRRKLLLATPVYGCISYPSTKHPHGASRRCLGRC